MRPGLHVMKSDILNTSTFRGNQECFEELEEINSYFDKRTTFSSIETAVGGGGGLGGFQCWDQYFVMVQEILRPTVAECSNTETQEARERKSESGCRRAESSSVGGRKQYAGRSVGSCS